MIAGYGLDCDAFKSPTLKKNAHKMSRAVNLAIVSIKMRLATAQSILVRILFLLLWIPLIETPLLAGPTPWYSRYEPIKDPRAEKFVAEALSGAIDFLGEPAVPVRKIYLRSSIPLDPQAGLKSKFVLTEQVDASEGVFAIYLSRAPEEYAFYGQLAHEVAHLLNARLYDCYVEGLNTVFAERFLKTRHSDWTGWDEYLRNGSDRFYGSTYLMMRELVDAIGEGALKHFLSFARWTDKKKTRMHIDIDAWLSSIPIALRDRAQKVILRHAKSVRAASTLLNPPYTFKLPE